MLYQTIGIWERSDTVDADDGDGLIDAERVDIVALPDSVAPNNGEVHVLSDNCE